MTRDAVSVEVECPSCGKKLRAPETSAGKHAKCPRCQGIIAIPTNAPAYRNGSRAASASSTTEQHTKSKTIQSAPRAAYNATANSTAEWTMLAPDKQQYGPVTKAELDAWAQEGRLDVSCQLYRSGWTDWKWAAEVYPQLNAPVAPVQSVPIGYPAAAPAINPFAEAGAPVSSNGDAPFAIDDFSASTEAARSPAPPVTAGQPPALPRVGVAPTSGRASASQTSGAAPNNDWLTVQIGLRIANYSCWVGLVGSTLFFLSLIVGVAAPPKDGTSIGLLAIMATWGAAGITTSSVSLVTGWFVCNAAPARIAGAGLLKGALLCVAVSLGAAACLTLLPLFGASTADSAKTLITLSKVLLGIIMIAGVASVALFGFFLGEVARFFGDLRLPSQALLFAAMQAGGCVWALLTFFVFTPDSHTLVILILIVHAAVAIGSVVWLGLLVRWAAGCIRRG